jgi:hypothetical protein
MTVNAKIGIAKQSPRRWVFAVRAGASLAKVLLLRFFSTPTIERGRAAAEDILLNPLKAAAAMFLILDKVFFK